MLLNILNYYEKKDIFLNLDFSYYYLKEKLLQLPKRSHEDIRQFIIDIVLQPKKYQDGNIDKLQK
jgi:hypothetical protein